MSMLDSSQPRWRNTTQRRDTVSSEAWSRLASSNRGRSIVGGMCGGISLVAIGHPFDTVKVKLQTQSSMQGSPAFRGPLHCLQRTIQTEGLVGLYQGLPSPLVGQIFKSVCLFTTYDEVKSAILARNGGLALTPVENFCAGALGGGIVALFESPADLFKSKMQTQASSCASYSSTLDCVRQVTRSQGIRGWYQGFCVAVVMSCCGNGLFFALFHALLARLDPQGERRGGAVFVAGAGAGCVFTGAVFPLDTVKASVMADSCRGGQRTYRGALHCARTLYAHHGLRAFTRGMAPALLRATPGCGMMVATVDAVKHAIAKRAAN